MRTIDNILKASELLAADTLGEEKVADDYLRQLAEESGYYREVIDSYRDIPAVGGKLARLDAYRADSALESTRSRIFGRERPGRTRRILCRYASVAALLALAVFAGKRLVVQDDSGGGDTLVAGTMKAVMITPEGKVRNLGSGESSLTVKEIESSSRFSAGEAVPSRGKKYAETRIVVPYGGEYNFFLSDGTRVWLNSDSEISFPSEFAGTLREVSVSGEVYFDVAKDSLKPFVVKAGRLQVKVLGTSFNVRSFRMRPEDEVTLTCGKVEILDSAGETLALLRPNQQLLRRPDGTVDIREVDPESVSAWKEGIFLFDNQTLEYIMGEISRWYNVKVEFGDERLKSLRFYINISRSDTHEILDIISTTKECRFEIENSTVKVLPVKH